MNGTLRHYLDEPMARVALRAKLARPLRTRRFHSFGPESLIHRPEWIYGPHRIAIGRGVVFLGHAWLSAERATWERPEPAITVGEGTMFRAYAVISASSSITIEDNVLAGSFVTIVDSDHTISELDQNALWNPVESEPVRVGAGTWLGERVTVLRGTDIGRKCIIGAHSVVRGKIPDYSIAVGAPATVVGTTLDDPRVTVRD
jgi:acetyltransferase-like isoleucine patch superfamily enzyme